MTKQEALEKIEELKKFVEESDKKKGTWRAENGGYYWYVESSGNIFSSAEDGYWADDARWEIGNYYETKEQAKKEIARRKVIAKLWDLNEGFEPDWKDDDQEKYLIVRRLGQFWSVNVTIYTHEQFTMPYFATERAAVHAINTLGDELDVLLD